MSIHRLFPVSNCEITPKYDNSFVSTDWSVLQDSFGEDIEGVTHRKAAGPDGVCPRLLKACAVELAVPLQHIFNLSLHLGKVLALWKTSCLIPVPKKPHPSVLNDYRSVALTSHISKTML